MPTIPYNAIRASQLQQELQREYSKPEWREAMASALRRWEAKGNKPQRVARDHTPRYTYSE